MVRFLIRSFVTLAALYVIFLQGFGLARVSLPSLVLAEPVESARDLHDHSHEEEGGLPGNVSIKVGDTLQPQAIDVSPGTTIVWINNSGKPMKIRFLEKAVSTTCKAPRGFKVGRAGVYESMELVDGEVASLCFLEPENYQYVVDLQRVSTGQDVLVADTSTRKDVVTHLEGSVSVVR